MASSDEQVLERTRDAVVETLEVQQRHFLEKTTGVVGI